MRCLQPLNIFSPHSNFAIHAVPNGLKEMSICGINQIFCHRNKDFV